MNARSNTAAATKAAIVRPDAPAPAVALRDPEHEDRETRRDEHGAGKIEALAVPVEALLEEDRSEDQRGDPDRDVHEEDPLPREEVDENAAEKHACGRPDAADRAPRAEGDVALAPLLEHGDEDRERGGRDRRRAEPLQGTESDQRLVAPRETAEERSDREDERADHEDAPAPEQVG